MREVKILSIDNRGRILIPQALRKIAGFATDTKLMVVADSERKEIKITSIRVAEGQNLLNLKISMKDIPGALGKIASTLGDLGISILYSEGGILEKDKVAFYTALVQSPKHDYKGIKDILLSKGSALDVELLPME